MRRYGPVGGADTVTLDYDSRGRLQVRRDASGTTRYDYDPYGNLRSVELPSRTVRYLADPLGRRIARDVEGTRTHAWVYGEGLAPLGQLDASGRLEVTFIYLTRDWVPDLALHRDGTLYRVVSDPIGSVRAVIDLTTGAVVQRYEYSPFGEIERAEETRDIVPFRFAGGLYDELTGLTRFGARDYDARLGRWTAKDPIGFAGGDSNLYGYVANDPVNYFDPSGLLADTVSDGAAVIGSCFVAPIRDALAGCGNGSAHAARCAMSLAAFVIPGVTAGMLHGALALKGLAMAAAPFGPRGGARAFSKLAQLRAGLGVPGGTGTFARLDIGGKSFYGINAHGQRVTLRVNPISRSHAETDAFQQAYNAGVSEKWGVLYVDRDLCGACGRSAAVKSMARQIGLEELIIVTPSGVVWMPL